MAQKDAKMEKRHEQKEELPAAQRTREESNHKRRNPSILRE